MSVSPSDLGTDASVVEPPGPLSLALMTSGARCLLMYVVLPVLGPLLGSLSLVAVPIVLGLYVLGIALSVRASRRAVTDGRWGAFVLAGGLLLLNLASLLLLVG